jgi:DNase/tRNase domain of colicin-like bacteriocin
LLLGHTSLIERQGDRFVVRERGEIERLLKGAYHGELPVDRLMGGLATVASALNANDQCLARIAAVHLKIPDLPSAAVRDAIAAEDSLIKYARDESSGGANWNPALHPRSGAPPNPGWFAPTDGHDSSAVRVAENQDDSHRTDATRTGANLMNQPATGGFWSNISTAVRNWLQESVPEYDLESGRVVGERPRWRAIAPYVGISAAAAAILGGEAALPFLGFGGGVDLSGGAADIAAQTAVARTANGRFYSVAFEMRLSPSSYPGVSRGAHFQEANEALLRTMESDPQFAQMMQNAGVNLERTAGGLAPRTPPMGLSWHHAESPGVMQLVPRAQHTPGSIFWDTLHPGGRGGYAIWGQ